MELSKLPDHPTRIVIIKKSNLTYPVKCRFFKDSPSLLFDVQEDRENARKYLTHPHSCTNVFESRDIIAP